MMRKICVVFVIATLSLVLFPPHLFAIVCGIDSDTIDRGEKKALIICGAAIPSNYTIEGLSKAAITVEYAQYLKKCGIGVKRPGIYLIIRAEDNAKTASVNILNADTGKTACESFTLEVPDRIHLKEASLEEPGDPNLPFKILKIKAGTSQDLSEACAGGITFPQGKWLSLSLISKQDTEGILPELKSSYLVDQPLICKKSYIRALVKVQGQQRYPAKIIISQVGLPGGETKEGVAYVTLPPPAWASAMRDEDAKYVHLNGIRTRYFEKGKGDALLLIHGGQAGGTSNAQNWEQNFEYLSRYFHVYAIDKLGSGYTDNPKTDRDYQEYYTQVVDHIYEFMKTVGIEKIHLIGQSQGGWPVTRIALDHPEMVKSLVNMSSAMAPADPQARSMPFMMYYMFFVNPPEGATPESIQRGMEMWSYSMNNITDEKVQRAWRLSRLPKRLEARKQMIKHRMNPAHPSFCEFKEKTLGEIKAGQLKVPTLVVWGYNDPSMIYEVGIELFKCLSSNVPGAQLHMFDNCGHSPYIEYPELFNRLIKSFCGAYASPPLD